MFFQLTGTLPVILAMGTLIPACLNLLFAHRPVNDSCRGGNGCTESKLTCFVSHVHSSTKDLRQIWLFLQAGMQEGSQKEISGKSLVFCQTHVKHPPLPGLYFFPVKKIDPFFVRKCIASSTIQNNNIIFYERK